MKDIKSNPFAKKIEKTMQHRDLDRQVKAMGGGVPAMMRRDAIKQAKKK